MLNFIIKEIFLNINNLYDINLNEWDNVFLLTEIELLEFFNYEELNYKIIFEKEVEINRSTSDYEKCITEIINKLLELKSKDELNIRLYIIDKKIKTFISCGYNSPDCVSEEKEKWLWYDVNVGKWWYIKMDINMKNNYEIKKNLISGN